MSDGLTRRSLLVYAGRGLGLAAGASLLAACGSSAAPAPQATLAPSSAAAAASPVTQASPVTTGGGGSKLTLTYLNASAGQEQALIALNQMYEQQTGVHIELTTQALDYPQKLLAAAQASQMPDLYYPGQTGSLDEHAPFVKAGWALNLKPEMDKGWKSNFQPELLAYTTYVEGNPQGVAPGIYSIPFDGNNWQILQNPAIWTKAGVDSSAPPKTWDEFITVAKNLKKATPQAFAMNLAQGYGTTAFLQTIATNFMSVDDLIAYDEGKKPWTDPIWKQVLAVYEQIRDANILAPGSVSWQMPDLEKGFFAQQTLASYFGFAISVPVGNRLAPDFKTYSAMVPPPTTAGKDVRVYGGIGKSVAINAKGSHVEEALKYLHWFMDTPQQVKYAQLLPTIPANPAAQDPKGLDPRTVPFASAMSKLLPPRAALRAPVEEAHNKGIQQIINKEASIDQVLSAMQQAQAGA